MRPAAAATALVALLAPLVLGQLDSLPKCAQDCFGNSLGSCKQLDFKCVCGNATLISSLSCCVANTCSPQEQASVIQLASGLCQAQGITVPTQASCASGMASSTRAPSASGGAGGSNSTGVSQPTPSATNSASPSARGSSSPAGGVPMATAGAMGLAMGVAGMLFAL